LITEAIFINPIESPPSHKYQIAVTIFRDSRFSVIPDISKDGRNCLHFHQLITVNRMARGLPNNLSAKVHLKFTMEETTQRIGEIAEIIVNDAINIFTNYFNLATQVEVDFPRVKWTGGQIIDGHAKAGVS